MFLQKVVKHVQDHTVSVIAQKTIIHIFYSLDDPKLNTSYCRIVSISFGSIEDQYYTGCLVTLLMLQDIFSELIPSQKCHMIIYAILNGYATTVI